MKRIYKYCLLIGVILILALNVQAQEVSVSGRVLDKDNKNQPIPGVTIVVQDSANQKIFTRGVTSDVEGKFSIRARVNSRLKFSFVGYSPATYKVTGAKSGITILMVTEYNPLDEVVVVGYENKSMADVTSATVVVETKDLVMTPVSNVMELLQGRVAGLNIQQNNGTPGMSGTYTIRGISDISVQGSGDNAVLSSSNPLFVVDGIPQEDVNDYNSDGLLSGSGVSPLSMIPYEDIDNIQILKDASATSLYGSKGAYGVILINTKKGNSPKPTISYSANFKVNVPPRLKDVVVGKTERWSRIDQILSNDTSYNGEYGKYLVNSNPFLSDSLNAYYNNNTDWQDVFYRITYNQTHNLAFSGGDKEFNYKVNGNYYEEKGIVKNTDFNRYTIRTNMSYAPSDKFDISVYMNVGIALNSTGSGSPLSQTGVALGSNTSSLLPPPSIYASSNAALGVLSVDDEKTTLNYDASVNLKYRPVKGLGLTGTFGYTYKTEEKETATPALLNNQRTKSETYSGNENTIYVRASAAYDRSVGPINLGLTLGTEISTKKETGNSITLIGLASDHITGPSGYMPMYSKGSANAKKDEATVSFTIAPRFGLGSIKGGADKYIFNPTIHPEANSAYGSQVKWTINPGLGFKWNFYLEPFMKKAQFLSYGAIRMSWGRNTKYKATIYDIWGTYEMGKNTYNGISVPSINFDVLPNVDLKPITSTQWNVGTDLYFWNRKLTLTMDAYYRQVDNQLDESALANHNAFDKMKNTEGSLVNYGLEVNVGTRPLPTSSDFDLNCNFTLAVNKDVLTRLAGEVRQLYADGHNVVKKVGINTMSNNLYVYKGVYANDGDVPVNPATGERLRLGGNYINNAAGYFQAGDPIWVDVNGDYIIDDKDRVIVGNSQARITGGVNLGLRYKGFSLSTNCSFTLKRDIINKSMADFFRGYYEPLNQYNALVPINAFDFWTPTHRGASYPNPLDYTRAKMMDPFRYDQTLFQEDGSYFKINGISVQYTLNSQWLKILRIRTLSVNASVNNIHTFSKYTGINPENVDGLGRDKSGGYPNSRSWSIGLNINF